MRLPVHVFVAFSIVVFPRLSTAQSVDYRSGNYRPIGAESNERLLQLLEIPVEFDFQETPLKSAIERLAAAAQVDLFIDKRGLEIAQVELNTPITLSSRYPLPLRDALQLVLDPLQLTVVDLSERFVVTDTTETAQQLFTRIYPIADLTYAPRLNSGIEVIRQFMGGIVATIATDTWLDNGGTGSIDYFPPTAAIIVTQTETVHGQIADLLFILRLAKNSSLQLMLYNDIDPENLTRRMRSSINPEPTIEGSRTAIQLRPSWLVAKLDERVSIAFDRLPLGKAIAELRQLGLPIDCHAPSLAVAGDWLERPISLRMTDVRAGSVAYWVAREAECWLATTAGDRLLLGSRDSDIDLDELYSLEDRDYDLGALLWDVEPDEQVRMLEIGAHCLMNAVATDTWAANGGTGVIRLRPAQHSLVVEQTIDRHRNIESLLIGWQKAQAAASILRHQAGAFDFSRPARESDRLPRRRPSAFRAEWLDSLPRPEPTIAYQAMSRRVSADFRKTPLEQAIQVIEQQIPARIRIDRKGLEIAQVESNQPLTVQFENLPLRSALMTMLDPIGLMAIVKGDELLVTDQTETGNQLFTRAYPAADIVVAEGMSPRRLMEELMKVHADTWADNGGTGSVEWFVFSYALVVTQTASVHEGVEDRLKAVRKNLGLPIR